MLVRECDVFRLTVEEGRAVGMTGCEDDLQLMVAEGDDVVIFQQSADGWLVFADIHAKETAGLVWHVFEQLAVLGANLGFQTVGFIKKNVAEIVVEMSVCGEEVYGFQLAVGDVTLNGRALFVVIGSAVDDDTFATVVADDVAVLLQRVAYDAFDIHSDS